MNEASSQTIISRLGSLNGNGRSSTARTRLKIAVFAPIPKAMITTATTVNPGFLASIRKANRKSWSRLSMSVLPVNNLSLFVPQRDHRVYFRCAPRRDETSQQRHSRQQQSDDR